MNSEEQDLENDKNSKNIKVVTSFTFQEILNPIQIHNGKHVNDDGIEEIRNSSGNGSCNLHELVTKDENKKDKITTLDIPEQLEEFKSELRILEELVLESFKDGVEGDVNYPVVAESEAVVTKSHFPFRRDSHGNYICFSESTQTERLTPREHVCSFGECPDKSSEFSNGNKKCCVGAGVKTSFHLAAKELRKKLEDLENRVSLINSNSVLLVSKIPDTNSTNTVNAEDAVLITESEIEATIADEFPLIPSPLLNTPPYETIVLTEQNESKYRIYLNPKIHHCFQQEVTTFHEKLTLDTANHSNNNEQITDKKVRAPSNNVSSLGSVTSIVPCFDPSEVDLELKEIFKEHQPMTHKIVRRRPRKERGSSVPAIDSFYGTTDIEKVGHASYFIPLLTESEKKCVGWKPEYHYGKWKYKFPILPNSLSGVLLHPKKSINHRTITKINIPYDGFSNIPDFGRLSECSSTQATDSTEKQQNEEDSLSFITLSNSTHPSLTPLCQLIPEKQTMKRFVRWIVPCFFKDRAKATTSQGVNVEQTDEEARKILGNNSNTINNKIMPTECKKLQEPEDRGDKKEKHHDKHHIHFNIFGGHGKSSCSESSSIVTGGDILISNTASVSYDYDSPKTFAAIDTSETDSLNSSNLYNTKPSNQLLDFSSDFRNTSLDSLEAPPEITVFLLEKLDLDKIESIENRQSNQCDIIMENKGTPIEAGIADSLTKKKEFAQSSMEDDVYISREYMSDVCLEDGYNENEQKTEFPYEDAVPPEIDYEFPINLPNVNNMTTNDSETDDESSDDNPGTVKPKSIYRSQGVHRILTLSSREHANIQSNNDSFSDDEDEEEPVIKLNKIFKQTENFTVNYFEAETFQQNLPKVQYNKRLMKIENQTVLQETRFLDPKDEITWRDIESSASSTSLSNGSNKDGSSFATTLTTTSEEITSDSEVENYSEASGSLMVQGKKIVVNGIINKKSKILPSELLKSDDSPLQNTTEEETVCTKLNIGGRSCNSMDEERNIACPEDEGKN